MRPARGGDVTDTWDSSRAAGSRAPAEREANLNANQELQRARHAEPHRRAVADFQRHSFRSRLFFTSSPPIAVRFT